MILIFRIEIFLFLNIVLVSNIRKEKKKGGKFIEEVFMMFRFLFLVVLYFDVLDLLVRFSEYCF